MRQNFSATAYSETCLSSLDTSRTHVLFVSAFEQPTSRTRDAVCRSIKDVTSLFSSLVVAMGFWGTQTILVLIPTQIACAKYLSSQPLLATAKAGIDAAAARCPAAPECNDYNALEQLTNDLNHECCDGPNQDCGTGLPSTCNAACAAVLLPMQAACAEYLSSTPLLAGAKESIDAVAALCP